MKIKAKLKSFIRFINHIFYMFLTGLGSMTFLIFILLHLTKRDNKMNDFLHYTSGLISVTILCFIFIIFFKYLKWGIRNMVNDIVTDFKSKNFHLKNKNDDVSKEIYK